MRRGLTATGTRIAPAPPRLVCGVGNEEDFGILGIISAAARGNTAEQVLDRIDEGADRTATREKKLPPGGRTRGQSVLVITRKSEWA